MSSEYTVSRVRPGEPQAFAQLLELFAVVFDDAPSYRHARPSAAYADKLLGSDGFFALVARADDEVVGALTAYELVKYEQERSEIYIYDLAVQEAHRRRGVATQLIRALQELAAERAAWVIFVQADYGDDPAVALYTKLGTREDVMHFDIPVPRRP